MPVIRSKRDLLRQFDSIKQVENYNYKRAYAKPLTILVVLTLLVLALFKVTDKEILINLKGVFYFLLLLCLVFCLCFLTSHLIQRQRHNASVRKQGQLEKGSGKKYFMSFTEQGLLLAQVIIIQNYNGVISLGI